MAGAPEGARDEEKRKAPAHLHSTGTVGAELPAARLSWTGRASKVQAAMLERICALGRDDGAGDREAVRGRRAA